MFTKNWYHYNAALGARGVSYASAIFEYLRCISGERLGELSSALSGKSVETSYIYDMMTYPRASLPVNDVKPNNFINGVLFGSGSTPATIDDYNLSGEVITTFTETHDITIAYDIDHVLLEALYTLVNTGDSPVTIGEVGLFGCAKWYANHSSQTSTTVRYGNILYERTVLEMPITIEPGGVGQVTYTLRTNYPTT